MNSFFQIQSPSHYHQLVNEAKENPSGFWEKQAECFEWFSRWTKVHDGIMEKANHRWYVDGKCNITVNCLDRHLATNGNAIAYTWEPNHPDQPPVRITYQDLYERVSRFGNALRALGVSKGDRVCLYMPMIPDVIVGVLACARIGAVHSVVFAGFSSQSLADRIIDAGCTIVLCADAGLRGHKTTPVKEIVDEALAMGCDTVRHVIVKKHTGAAIDWDDARDHDWDTIEQAQPAECQPAVMDSEDPLFILYTSGSTGKPKGVVHTVGGYMVYAMYSFLQVFQYKPGELFWCTADVGWITGHTYVIYGPLLAGAASLIYEGIPTFPDASRCWQIVEKYRVNIFYTAPTAIRALMAAGDHYVEGIDMSSIRVLGTVGEPINEEAWHWYQNKIGRGVIPIADTWWQTETGGIMISPIPYVTDAIPCYASYPLPGIHPVLLTPDGQEIEEMEAEGLLCIKDPWPSIIRTTFGDHERCIQTYFSAFPGYYFTGDGAKRDSEGRLRIIGRVDDVINVSGHRMGTAEIENAINQHPDVVESAVVGFPHAIKGQGIFAYVIVLEAVEDEDVFEKEIQEKLTECIGPIAKVDELMIVSGLPKTRSGKIMRRILRKIAHGESDALGDITTLLNPEIVTEIIAKKSRAK